MGASEESGRGCMDGWMERGGGREFHKMQGEPVCRETDGLCAGTVLEYIHVACRINQQPSVRSRPLLDCFVLGESATLGRVAAALLPFEKPEQMGWPASLQCVATNH